MGYAEGLLGNFDNDATNEFVSYDGLTQLPDNATDSENHYGFGLTCKYTLSYSYIQVVLSCKVPIAQYMD